MNLLLVHNHNCIEYELLKSMGLRDLLDYEAGRILFYTSGCHLLMRLLYQPGLIPQEDMAL